MKSLKAIQVLAKIGKIFSKIIFIFCIVGFCGCIAGIVSLALGLGTVKIGGVTLHSLIENNAGMRLSTLYVAMASGLIFCAAEAILCKFAELYFRHELADGNPFTLHGAKELLRLGILTVAIPVGAGILCTIGAAVAEALDPGVGKLSFSGFSSVGLGVMMIVLSLFCRYGASLREAQPEA